jgi:hypothetical protein
MSEHTFEYNPVPSNKSNINNRHNLKSNGKMIDKEEEINGNKINRNMNRQNNEINNAKINMNMNNGGNGVSNGYFPQNMINNPSMNYYYNNIVMGQVMNPQIMNMRGFIPQMQNNIAPINTLNPLNNINITNSAINMQMLNNNN